MAASKSVTDRTAKRYKLYITLTRGGSSTEKGLQAFIRKTLSAAGFTVEAIDVIEET